MKAQQYSVLRAMEDRHWWYRVLHGQVMHILEANLRRGAELLDAGCGTGGLLARVQGTYRVRGCDRSSLAVRHCHDRGLDQLVIQADVCDLPFSEAEFDAALLLDVLYHREVVVSRALAELRRVLRRSGLLVVNTAAFQCLYGAHDEAVHGARRYRSADLCRVLEEAGFKVLQAHYWNAWLFLPLLLRRRCFQEAEQSDLRMPPRWLNALLTIGTRVDAALCRMLQVPFGSSLMVLAQKLA